MTDIQFSISGRLAERGHELVQRVYYEDTDFSGAVYHARYLHFMERARTDYLRCLGINQSTLYASPEESLSFVVHRIEIDFKRPARMDDILTIRTTTEQAGGARTIMVQEIFRGDQPIVSARVVIAFINREGRPRRLPDGLAEKLLA